MRRAEKSQSEFFHNLAASAFSGAIGITLFNPLDCLRVRWQVAGPSCPARGTSGGSVARFGYSIVQHEGLVRGLWAPGLAANVGGVAVCNGVRFAVYPLVRDALDEVRHAVAVRARARRACAGHPVASASLPTLLPRSRQRGAGHPEVAAALPTLLPRSRHRGSSSRTPTAERVRVGGSGYVTCSPPPAPF